MWKTTLVFGMLWAMHMPAALAMGSEVHTIAENIQDVANDEHSVAALYDDRAQFERTAIEERLKTSPIEFDSVPAGTMAPLFIPGTADAPGVDIFGGGDQSGPQIVPSDGINVLLVGQGSVQAKFDQSILAFGFDMECPSVPMDVTVTLLDEQGGMVFSKTIMQYPPGMQPDETIRSYMPTTAECFVGAVADQPFLSAIVSVPASWTMLNLAASDNNEY